MASDSGATPVRSRSAREPRKVAGTFASSTAPAIASRATSRRAPSRRSPSNLRNCRIVPVDPAASEKRFKWPEALPDVELTALVDLTIEKVAGVSLRVRHGRARAHRPLALALPLPLQMLRVFYSRGCNVPLKRVGPLKYTLNGHKITLAYDDDTVWGTRPLRLVAVAMASSVTLLLSLNAFRSRDEAERSCRPPGVPSAHGAADTRRRPGRRVIRCIRVLNNNNNILLFLQHD